MHRQAKVKEAQETVQLWESSVKSFVESVASSTKADDRVSEDADEAIMLNKLFTSAEDTQYGVATH